MAHKTHIAIRTWDLKSVVLTLLLSRNLNFLRSKRFSLGWTQLVILSAVVFCDHQAKILTLWGHLSPNWPTCTVSVRFLSLLYSYRLGFRQIISGWVRPISYQPRTIGFVVLKGDMCCLWCFTLFWSQMPALSKVIGTKHEVIMSKIYCQPTLNASFAMLLLLPPCEDIR